MRQVRRFAEWARELDNRAFGESQGWRRPKWSTLAWTIPVVAGSQVLIRYSVGLAAALTVICAVSFLPLVIWERRRHDQQRARTTASAVRGQGNTL